MKDQSNKKRKLEAVVKSANNANKRRKLNSGTANKENRDLNINSNVVTKTITTKYGRKSKQRFHLQPPYRKTSYHVTNRHLSEPSDIVCYPNEGDISAIRDVLKQFDFCYKYKNTTPKIAQSPTKLKSDTPRKRQFIRMGKVTAQIGNEQPVSFYIFQEKVKNKSEFYTANSWQSKTFTPLKAASLPRIDYDKKVHGPVVVTSKMIAESKKRIHKSNLAAFHYHSADEIAVNYLGKNVNKTHYEFSHIFRRQHGGYEFEKDKKDQPKILTVTPAAHNSNRLAMVEEPATKAILGNGPMTYSVDADLIRDNEGNPTHIGGKNEISTWEKEIDNIPVKVDLKLDATNPEPSTKNLAKLMTEIYSTLFSKPKTKTDLMDLVQNTPKTFDV